ncbi:MAG: hypothetical protein OEW91_14450 [Acidimicrobiia bacterium]|nr:hypothetical protein [Acidimicrobiia bacterium]
MPGRVKIVSATVATVGVVLAALVLHPYPRAAADLSVGAALIATAYLVYLLEDRASRWRVFAIAVVLGANIAAAFDAAPVQLLSALVIGYFALRIVLRSGLSPIRPSGTDPPSRTG